MEAAIYLLSVILVLSAFGVVLSKNPIYSALSLILNLLGVAGMFGLFEAHFLSTTQVIVYAGAIMVLVIFVLMLLNVKIEKFSPKDGALAAFCSLLSLILIFTFMPKIRDVFPRRITSSALTMQSEGSSNSSMLRDANSVVGVPIVGKEPTGTVAEIGSLLYSQYVFQFEIASILILSAIVGAVILAKRVKGSS